jgi:D-galactarolactone cycloisomerase
MKIRDIRLLPLRGETPDGGWDEKHLQRETNLHTLLEVITDEGVTGIGSVFTSATLIQGAIDVMRPFLIGASAIDPAATSERLHQQTFWQGRGGSITHAISGIDIALWDILGKVTRQPISRLLGGRYRESIKPYGSLLMDEPERMRAPLERGLSRGFRAFKIGWGPFGRRDRKTDEAIVKASRVAVGPDVELMVDAGGSDAFWPHGYKWAIETARMLASYGVTWFEEPLRPDDPRRLLQAHRARPAADHRLRSLHPPAVLHRMDRAPRRRLHPARCDESGRHHRGASHRPVR